MSEKKAETTELAPVNSSFDLVIREMTIGTLTSNAENVLNSLKESSKKYSVEKYAGDAKAAAAERTKFNAVVKRMNDVRIAYEKQWMQPFDKFKSTINECISIVKTDVIAKLDVIVKEKENEEKEAKKAKIAEIWKVYDFNLIPLEKVFNPKWLNKTYKESQIHDDIAHLIDRITGDLESLEQFGEDTATLKELYLSTLDLQSTLRRGGELKENRKRLAEEEARKAEIEAQEQEEAPQNVEEAAQQAEQPQESAGQSYNVDFKAQSVTPDEEPQKKTSEPAYSFYVTMPIAQIARKCGINSEPILMTATKKQLLDFKEAMFSAGYEYDKLAYNGRLLLNVRAKGSR